MFSIFHKKKEPIKLWFATDIHCHVIPGIDDGSPDAATSADLIERMQSWGINRIIASPHVTQITFENDRSTIEPALEELRKELKSRGNNISVEHSAEYRLDDIFYQRFLADDLMPYPNKYLLVENPFIQEPFDLDKHLFDIQVKGYQPILAHPERYFYYHSHKNRYQELHDRGILLQVNLLSLAGHYGKEEKNIAEHMAEAGLIDFIGTDLHNAGHADSIDRYLRSADARRHRSLLEGRILNDKAFI